MSGNPPDKPGYKLLPSTSDWATDETNLNALADEGYSFIAFIADNGVGAYLLGNYKGQ